MAPSLSVFAGRRAVLATMHGKERAIGPAFREVLGIELEVPDDFDTDQFGTFSGEVERPGSLDEVLLSKARLGMTRSGRDLGVASEGSFGPHPQMPFIPVGLEKLAVIDARTGIVAIEQMVDLAPCYSTWEARKLRDIIDQVEATGFPGQAMIVRPNKLRAAMVQKAIQDPEGLKAAIAQAAGCSEDGLAFVQTDMRAHFNPRRMLSIASLAHKLASRLCQTCPGCNAPGWGVKRTEKGLPCSWCAFPTDWVLHEVMGCFICETEMCEPRSDGMTEADPKHCPYCNP